MSITCGKLDGQGVFKKECNEDIEHEFLYNLEANNDEQVKGFATQTGCSSSESLSASSQQQSFSDPVPLTLVSAMKGSRESQGLPLNKLTVSWAPDVYDPPVSIVSHTKGKQQQQQWQNQKHKSKNKKKDNYKRNGKKSQKAKNSSRGGKEKKHFDNNTQEDELDGFVVCSPESCFGDNFLISSIS